VARIGEMRAPPPAALLRYGTTNKPGLRPRSGSPEKRAAQQLVLTPVGYLHVFTCRHRPRRPSLAATYRSSLYTDRAGHPDIAPSGKRGLTTRR
jgi:hypothetical protein